MAVAIRKLSNTSVAVSGINTALAGKAAWRKILDKIGRDLQKRVADSFETQKVAGSRHLRPNSPEWNAYKRKHGHDPRRGHMTGRLQRALHSPQRLYSISAITSSGTCVIRMREDWLRSRVPYAEYYEQSKVQGGAILAIAKRWVEINKAVLLDFEKLLVRNAAANVGAGRVAYLNSLADKAEREIAARVDFARNAPFNEAVRPRYIKTTSGLTQNFMGQIGRQANAALAKSGRLQRMERLIERASRRVGN